MLGLEGNILERLSSSRAIILTRRLCLLVIGIGFIVFIPTFGLFLGTAFVFGVWAFIFTPLQFVQYNIYSLRNGWGSQHGVAVSIRLFSAAAVFALAGLTLYIVLPGEAWPNSLPVLFCASVALLLSTLARYHDPVFTMRIWDHARLEAAHSMEKRSRLVAIARLGEDRLRGGGHYDLLQEDRKNPPRITPNS